MKRTFLSLLLVAAFAALVPAPAARAQCGGSAWFCAEVRIGGSLQLAPPPPPRQQVYIVQQQPPPPVVYVQQPPPPPVATYVVAQPEPTYEVVSMEPQGQMGWGLHGSIGGMVSSNVAVGGGTVALRLRPNDGHFALDLGIGGYGGRDYNGLDRVEVPLTADVLVFFNPQHRLQVYGVAGLGVSFAHAEGFDEVSSDFVSRDYAYFGGELGAGLELRVSPWLAINGDLRGFVRERMDDDPRPEFVDLVNDRTTDTSGGLTLNLGATLYF